MGDNHTKIKLVVFDLAGTTIDFGCFAPLTPFIEALARHGIEISAATARGPMGLQKKEHLRALLQIPEVTEKWRAIHARDWSEEDVESIYQRDFVPLQMEALERHSELIPGLLECVAALRKQGIKIATTTGYFAEAARIVWQKVKEQGFEPDSNLGADDVPQGRPAPWMMFRHMEKLNVYPPRCVVKVGDTVPDMLEGRHAGAWSVGVCVTSSEVGLNEKQWQALSTEERQRILAPVATKLLSAGAHFIINSIADLPALLPQINDALEHGEKP